MKCIGYLFIFLVVFGAYVRVLLFVALRKVTKKNFPKTVVQTVDKNFYADDCLKFVDTVWEAMDIVHQFCDLYAVGGFRSTRWVRDNRRVQETIPD